MLSRPPTVSESSQALQHSPEEIQRVADLLEVIENAREAAVGTDFMSEEKIQHSFRLGDLYSLLGTMGYEMVEGPVMKSPFVKINGILHDMERFAKRLVAKERDRIGETLNDKH
jgi:hypothetical protein